MRYKLSELIDNLAHGSEFGTETVHGAKYEFFSIPGSKHYPSQFQ
jgi:hypothetical protein